MRIYEPTMDAPNTTRLDNWPPVGDFCRNAAGEYCVHFDPMDEIMKRKNWCYKHEVECRMDASDTPEKCVRCKVDLPGVPTPREE